MNLRIPIILIFKLIISNEIYSQNKISSSFIKGEWMIRNYQEEFYNSDTLVFYKKLNEDLTIAKHNGKRPFLESYKLLSRDTPRIILDLNKKSKAVCSDVSFTDKEQTMNIYERIWGKWELKNNLLIINSEKLYYWHFKILEVSKVSFTSKGKEYLTYKMIAVKQKFENYD